MFILDSVLQCILYFDSLLQVFVSLILFPFRFLAIYLLLKLGILKNLFNFDTVITAISVADF